MAKGIQAQGGRGGKGLPGISDVPMLVVTNPVWLWVFRRGWEDPNWGTRPIDQHAIATSIYELAETIADVDIRTQIQGSAARLMSDTMQNIVRGSQLRDEGG
jgi:hypothetical protein